MTSGCRSATRSKAIRPFSASAIDQPALGARADSYTLPPLLTASELPAVRRNVGWVRRAAVIAGAQDRLPPPTHARRIAAWLPQPHSLTILPDTGHMGPLERPQEMTRALVALADRVWAQAGAGAHAG